MAQVVPDSLQQQTNGKLLEEELREKEEELREEDEDESELEAKLELEEAKEEDKGELPDDEEGKELLKEETVPIGAPVLVEDREVLEELEEEEEKEDELEWKEELKEDLLEEEEGAGAQTGDHGHPLLSNSHSLSISAYPNGQ